jgi:hypothetical protein
MVQEKFGRNNRFGNATMRDKQRKEINEEEFFSFAKKYLSEAFPNPERIDCPGDWELIRLSEHPREADPFTPEHITSCSPCFNRYMEILADLKRRKAGSS